MFTINQIKEAHCKVKSGADFPNYIYDIKNLGIEKYETYVADGHSVYYGKNNFKISSEPKYEVLKIENTSNETQFRNDLKTHQQGKTSYLTFCNDCAKSGIEKWIVDISKMTCTYFDIKGNVILVENIPSAN